jgi:hypothetical protein
MNGEITVESEVGKGSTFTLSLPRAPRMDLSDVPPIAEAAKVESAKTEPAKPEPAKAEANDSSSGLADRALQETPHS